MFDFIEVIPFPYQDALLIKKWI